MEKDTLERLEGIADWLGSAGAATGPLAHLDSKRCKEAAQTIREAIKQTSPDKPCDTELTADTPNLVTDDEICIALGVKDRNLSDTARDNMRRLYNCLNRGGPQWTSADTMRWWADRK